METNKSRITRMSEYLNINHLDIINNPNLNEGQKQKELFKTALSAILEKHKGSENLKELNIEEFVENQCQAMYQDNNIFKFPAIYMLREEVDRLRSLRGNDIKKAVEKLFDTLMSTSEETDPNAIVTLLLSIGALGLSVVGGVISVFAIGTGGFTTAGVLGLIAAGTGIVYSVASMIYSIFACIDFERDFFGLIINDTKYDMLIEGRFQNYEHNDKERVGVYLKHGDLSAIVYDSDENGNNYKTYIKNNLTDGKDGAFMGIFKFSKTPFPNTVGSEGIIRMKGNNRFIDVFAACPASNDNRMMISCQYSNNDLKRADEAMYKQCGGKSPYVESNGNLYLKSAVNSFSDSPTWGIASVSEI